MEGKREKQACLLALCSTPVQGQPQTASQFFKIIRSLIACGSESMPHKAELPKMTDRLTLLKKSQKIHTHSFFPRALSFCKWFVIPDKYYIMMKQKSGAMACYFFRRKDILKTCYYSTILKTTRETSLTIVRILGQWNLWKFASILKIMTIYNCPRE